MFVSESGICRGPLAAALFSHMIANSPLRSWVDVQARVSKQQAYVRFLRLCSPMQGSAVLCSSCSER
jgi:hypothetical protein